MSFPGFISAERRPTVNSRHKFWHTIDDHVKYEGCFVLLKRFKHGFQSFFPKKNAGVDGATPQRSILRTANSHFE